MQFDGKQIYSWKCSRYSGFLAKIVRDYYITFKFV